MSRVGTRPAEQDKKARLASKAVYKTKLAPQLRTALSVTTAAVRWKGPGKPEPKQEQARSRSASKTESNEYVPPKDKELAEFVSIRWQYLQAQGLEEEFSTSCKVLLSRSSLPYNPYPGFVHRLRDKAEMFHLSNKEILLISNSRIGSAGYPHLFQAGQEPIWGMESMLETVNPVYLRQFQWLVEDLTPPSHTLDSDDLHSVQVTMSLTGPGVFYGSFYEKPVDMVIRAEYLVVGPDPEVGVRLFVKSIIKDIHHTKSNCHHTFLGLEIPGKKDDTHLWWSYESVLEKEVELQGSMIECIHAFHFISIKCIFKFDPQLDSYVFGEKQYGLNFIEADPANNNKSKMMCYTDLPFSSPHEGVFFSQHEALSYMSAFAKNTDSSSLDIKEEEGSKTVVEGKSSKVLVGGFRYSSTSSDSPHAWQILAPIQTYHQKRIAKFNQYLDLLQITHCAILLYVMDRSAYGEIIQSVARFMQSTAMKVSFLQLTNKTLEFLLTAYAGHLDMRVIASLLLQYRRDVEDIFFNAQREQSSDLETIGKVILQRVNEVTDILTLGQDTYETAREGQEKLKALYNYTVSVQVQLAASALQLCHPLAAFIENLREKFGTGEAQRNKIGPSSPASQYVHGSEAKNVESDSAILNIDTCISHDSAPHTIAKEAVLFKYITDTHLDEVWQHFLTDLMSGSVLPPNPYPRFLSYMRRSAHKMSLWYENDERLLREILHGNERPERPQHYVYHIPGCDVHGPVSAMQVLDNNFFFKIAPMANLFIQKTYQQKKYLYKIAICTAIAGESAYTGRLEPYLLQLVLHEHCYIRGPDGCADEAIQIYSKIVFDDILQLENKVEVVLHGVQLGGPHARHRWHLTDILTRRKAFTFHLEKAIQEKEAVFIKAFIKSDWRYLPVVKHLLFHYISDDENRFEKYFPDKPATFYMNFFTSADKAAFHFQYGGPPDQSDPYNVSNVRLALQQLDQDIVMAASTQNWLSVHRSLVTRNLINKGFGHITEAWRMLHSVAGQFEYVISLGRSLQDLLQYCLEHAGQIVDDPSSDVKIGSINIEQLNQMTLAYYDKVMSVCRLHVAMTPVALCEIIQEKLQAIFVSDLVSNKVALKLEDATISTLEEVNHTLEGLQDVAAADVQAISPRAQAAVTSIQAELRARPASVQSLHPSQHLGHSPIMMSPAVNILAESEIRATHL